MKARKLPSGSWRVQVYAGTVNGKRVYESFTASTKKEAERQAAVWNADRQSRGEDLTVKDAIRKYIDAKENVLSASTVRVYETMLHRFDGIAGKRIRVLKDYDVQKWVSALAAEFSPKTVKNTYGLLTSSVKFFGGRANFNVRLPAKTIKTYRIPTEQDIRQLLSHADEETQIAIMLARYYSLRAGEICALDSSDLVGDVLTVRKAMTLTKDKRWIIQERPKTDDSYRSLIVSEPLISVLKQKDGKFITCTPQALTDRFRALVRKAGIVPCRFHDLRHAFATNAAIAGIPDIYTAKMGGWNPNSSVLKQVYQNVQDAEYRKQMEVLNKQMQHEISHDKEETPQKRGLYDAARGTRTQ